MEAKSTQKIVSTKHYVQLKLLINAYCHFALSDIEMG